MTAARQYNEYLDEYEYCEEAGFDGLMLNEHHNTPTCLGATLGSKWLIEEDYSGEADQLLTAWDRDSSFENQMASEESVLESKDESRSLMTLTKLRDEIFGGIPVEGDSADLIRESREERSDRL